MKLKLAIDVSHLGVEKTVKERDDLSELNLPQARRVLGRNLTNLVAYQNRLAQLDQNPLVAAEIIKDRNPDLFCLSVLHESALHVFRALLLTKSLLSVINQRHPPRILLWV